MRDLRGQFSCHWTKEDVQLRFKGEKLAWLKLSRPPSSMSLIPCTRGWVYKSRTIIGEVRTRLAWSGHTRQELCEGHSRGGWCRETWASSHVGCESLWQIIICVWLKLNLVLMTLFLHCSHWLLFVLSPMNSQCLCSPFSPRHLHSSFALWLTRLAVWLCNRHLYCQRRYAMIECVCVAAYKQSAAFE